MYLTRKEIRTAEFINSDDHFKTGASVLFRGVVRGDSEGKKVLYLEYEAYEEMAEQMMSGLVASAFDRWPLEEVKILHRLGRVWLGQIALAIEVKSAHRDEAYQASRYLIEEIKHKVPIWKKEYFADGTSEWSVCPSNYVDLQRSS
jgi:molybdopterin synthase catalytic subunit